MAGYKKPYTIEEQRKILRYIINTQGYHSVRGKQFWKTFEESGAINRTWQSAKEHFLKQVFPQLQNAKFQLSDEEIQLIRNGCVESANSSKSSKTLTSENPKTVDLSLIVDSSDEEI